MCEQHMSDFCTSSDPDNIWKTLKKILLKCKELFVPIAVSNVHNKPHWNKKLSELSTRLREARRQFKYRSSYENGDKLDQIKAQFKAMLAAAQQRYLESKSKKLNDHNGETFWKDFKSLFYKKGENLVGDRVGANEEIIEDDVNKAEYMFNKIFGGSSNYCPPTSPTMTQKSAIPLYNSQLQQLSQPITIQEITQALAKLKTSGKSSDFDGIHPKMLKQGKNFFLIALHCLFNKILSTHQWPWNSSNLVIFLRKPGKKDYKDVSSYRPITISSHIGKTLERIMEQRLRSLVENWSLIPNSQFGFRQGRSTLMYLLNLLTETTHYTKSKLCTAALFLDVQKAFDTVNHQHMIYRLQELGLEGNYLHVIDSFLTKREISLKINNHIHPATKCQIGLPQGSALSPLLFIIYIRDMLSSIDGTGLQYADDCTVLMTGKDSSELQIRIENNCQQIQTWMDRWNLLINYQKTEIVVFNGDITPPIINANTIQISTSSKVLGIAVDDHLTFEKQYSISTKCLTQRMNMLKPFIYAGLSPDTSKKILTQVIMPKALYGASLWDYKNHDLPAHLYQTAPRSSPQPSHRITTLVGKHPTSKPCIHQREIAINQRIGQN
ncbi:MAP3K7 [Bugula neritina]|uniref:MAP3K7 n=1 Tax=Bugula neritina TaxID=10212 RepID=A0A7J7JM92_BUGNE|nr:MAP3K7 [Bugula neritina]